MTVRELLELAAKAAGMPVTCWLERLNAFELPGFGTWNPLTDDGDALRLAVKLNMGISIPNLANNRIDVVCFTDCSINVIEENNIDPYAATRRAIVRAAAAIAQEAQ